MSAQLTEGAVRLGSPKATKTAQRLRREMTPPEKLLWQALRRDQLGHRFRRQHPVGPYVLDFFCARAGLCVEVDGEHTISPSPAMRGETIGSPFKAFARCGFRLET